MLRKEGGTGVAAVQIPSLDLGLSELYPLFVGYEDCESGHSFGPAVREHYLVHYIRSGRGKFFFSGKEYDLSPGQCFLICPGKITVYTADEAEPWKYTWLAFSGKRAADFLREAGLGPEAPVAENSRLSAFFTELHRKIRDGSFDKNDFAMASEVYAFFAALPRNRAVLPSTAAYVEKVRSYVARMYQNPIRVGQLAAFCGLERHYLCRVFKAETGITLQQCIIEWRMRRARELLLSSALNVGEAARSVGYTDVYNFSKMFKKQFGYSPLKARKGSG